MFSLGVGGSGLTGLKCEVEGSILGIGEVRLGIDEVGGGDEGPAVSAGRVGGSGKALRIGGGE